MRALSEKERLVLVNARHPWGRSVPGDLVPVDGIFLREEAAAALVALLKAAGADGELELVSGWRSYKEQEEIYAGSLKDNGLDFTQKYVALPGCSEHQTGLAADVGLRGSDFICPAFPDKGLCGRFRGLAADYGFILRYPKGKEALTGIAHEPWHFRYVGLPHSRLIEKSGVVLEEYHAVYKGGAPGEN